MASEHFKGYLFQLTALGFLALRAWNLCAEMHARSSTVLPRPISACLILLNATPGQTVDVQETHWPPAEDAAACQWQSKYSFTSQQSAQLCITLTVAEDATLHWMGLFKACLA